MGLDPESLREVIVGNEWRCSVCGLRWFDTPEGGTFIPEPNYWKDVWI